VIKKPKIVSGYIYSDVISKRLDETVYEMRVGIQKAVIYNSKLVFLEGDKGFEQAMKEGIFALRIPNYINLTYCDSFAQTFYKVRDVKKSRSLDELDFSRFRNYTSDIFDDNLLGFHERVDQIEQFLLEKRFWKEWYPQEIAKVGDDLCNISSIIIRNILRRIGVPEEDYSKATGGCSDKNGSYHLTFNHYRPGKKTKGLSSHKDDGFVTILRTISQGLEVNRHSRWEMVLPDTNYFIINFGLAMELLTKNSGCPVSAIMHRVTQQTLDRWSWGHFSSSNCNEGLGHEIYEYSKKQGLIKICTSRDLINNNDHEIYFGTKLKNEIK